MKRKVIATSVLLAAVIVIGFAGVILYYNNIIDYYNSIINQRDSEIASLKSEIANLKKPDLVTTLGISERMNNLTYDANNPSTYNHLLISGTVTNMGLGTAYNAGLHVVAWDVTGELVINMTVPIAAGSYGLGGNQGPSTLTTLGSKETGTAQLAIYHKGILTSWTVTPVWTD
jgi:hypothetical protein